MKSGSLAAALMLSAFALPLTADSGRDFSGKWFLDAQRSRVQSLSHPVAQTLTVKQDGLALQCEATYADGAVRRWSYLLDGTETRASAGDLTESNIAKWEGVALLINSQVTGARDYTVMDRWYLTNASTLTITRQIVRRDGQVEGSLVYTRSAAAVGNAAATAEPKPAAVPPAPPSGRAPSPAAPTPADPEPVARVETPERPRELVKQPPPPATPDFVVARGTHIGLSLRNALDTKHTKTGDHVYLETIAPITVAGRIVIPPGSFVNGTVTESTPAKTIKKKGEMYIRFDSLVLPNGVTRDFRSRLVSADGEARGTVDAKEGSITGERDGSGDARTVAVGTGVGASVGAIAGSAAGHPITGVGIGAATGAGVALATILHGKKPEAVLPRGAILEMVLDRDLVYTRNEIPW